MSNIQVRNMKEIVDGAKVDFEKLAKIHGVVNFLEEASFATQILSENDFLMKTAIGNPDSLRRAVINVAAIGLSLNPYAGYAYLIPRKGKVCMDISYRGHVKLAQDEGAIKMAVAEIVKEKDEFIYKGPHVAPIHNFDPYSKRGAIRGGYVIATLPTDDVIVTHMPIWDIYGIRDRSESWKAFLKNGRMSPWNTDEEEMIKKTLFRRARKSWPLATSSRYAKVQEVTEEADPINFDLLPDQEDAERADLLLKIRAGLEILGKTEEGYLTYLRRVNRRNLTKLEEMTTVEMEQQLVILNQMVDKKNAEKK